MRSKLTGIATFVLCLIGTAMAQSNFSLLSPNKQVEIKVRAADRVQYDVLFKGTALLQNSTLSINIDHKILGTQPKVTAHKEDTHDGIARAGGPAEIRQDSREL